MCGIAAFFLTKNIINESTRDNILRKLSTRGPDASKMLTVNSFLHETIYNQCELFHTRLSIIETSNASNQPFVSTCRRFTLIFNGEIYNYLSLKKILERMATTFGPSPIRRYFLIAMHSGVKIA